MEIRQIVEEQRAFFNTGVTRSSEYRAGVLAVLKSAIREYEPKILKALQEDLGKAGQEAYMSEVGMVLEELSYVQRHLSGWMRPRRVHTPLAQFPSKSRIYPEPYGVALILSPWNYPFQLCMEPLIGALAAGNCAVLKPSNYSPHVSEVIAELIHSYFEPRLVEVVLGGREQNQDLLNQKFDYLFFTGGKTVGRLVMEAAARTLTPVTLELGGKSPCIIDHTADLDLAARRLAFGKFLNAGQTCVAPDYVLTERGMAKPLAEKLQKEIFSFFGENPLTCEEYPRIINRRHYDRLLGLLDGAEVAFGGQGDPDMLKIQPTVLTNVSWEAPVMGEEIFGPILPILEYDQLTDALQEVRGRERPLALYLFTRDKKTERLVRSSVSFGGGCVNDTIVHLATSHMPFGGVGESGMGGYHGKFSFDTFTHYKSILKKGRIDLPVRYHPYSAKKEKLIRKLMK